MLNIATKIVTSSNQLLLSFGSSYDEDEINRQPFNSPGSDQYIITGLLRNGKDINLIDVKRQSLTPDTEQDFKETIFKFIKDNNIERIIIAGKRIAGILFPSICSGTIFSKLVTAKYMVPQEMPSIKVGLINDPFSICDVKNPDIIEEWFDSLTRKLVDDKDDDIIIHVNQLSSEEDLFDLIRKLDSSKSKYLGLDYETNAVDPFHDPAYCTIIGLSETIDANSANAWYYVTGKGILSDRIKSIINFFFKRNFHRIWTFNAPMEIKWSWYLFGDFFKFQDAMVLMTVYAKRGSLKNIVRQELGAPFWESGVHEFKDTIATVFRKLSRNADAVEMLKNGDIQSLIKPDSPIPESAHDILVNLTDEWGTEIMSEAITHYPYEWGAVPKEMLGTYCAYDAAYTGILAYRYYDDMAATYGVYIRHPWLASIMEVNGVPFDDDQATKVLDDAYSKMFELLYEIILLADLPEKDKLEAASIYSRKLPYEVVWYTEKTKQERRKWIRTPEQKLGQLQEIFNPNSNLASSRDIFFNKYSTEDIKMASILLLFIENIELNGEQAAKLKSLLGDNFFYTNSVDEVMSGILDLQDTTQDSKLKRAISDSLNTAIEDSDNYLGRFASDVIKFQYRVHTTFFKVNIDDRSTWNDQFKMLFNIFYFKKLNKMVGNLTGGIGRDSVWYSRIGTNNIPQRIQPYHSGPPADGYDLLIMDTSFNSLAAVTTRWTAAYHTSSQGSPPRRCYTTRNKRQLWLHADYSQAELVILAFMSADEGMIQTFLDKKDMHKFAASKIHNKNYDDVTSLERKSSKSIVFAIIYGKHVSNLAIEVTHGDVIAAQRLLDIFYKTFPGIRIWMDKVQAEAANTGYVTGLFGNKLFIDPSFSESDRNRYAVNYPIQCTANTIAGTSMYQLYEASKEANLEMLHTAFVHDALDTLIQVDDLLLAVELTLKVLQDDIFRKMKIPMRVDYEVGVDSYNLCHIEIGDGKIKLKGEKEAVELLVERLETATTYRVSNYVEISSKITNASYEDMFVNGTALLCAWGREVVEVSAELNYEVI